MRFVPYVRVSQVGGREGESFISPGEQKAKVEAWAKALDHELTDVYEDLDQPGSRLDRPQLTAAMAVVESGEADGIVVAKLDRFTRSTAHLGPLIERLRKAGGVLVSVGEGIDTSTPAGKLVADIMGAISEWELSRIRDNWAAARKNAVDRGVFVGGTVPIGYLKGEDGRLTPDPATELQVRQLFDRRASQESWASLASWFTGATGGERTWTTGAIRALIVNRTYLGEVRGGSGLVKAAAHPPLVDRDVWLAANQVRGLAPARSGRASGLLAGILRCAGCRYAMKVNMGKTRHGKARLEYRCKSARSEVSGRCPAPAAVSAPLVEELVVERFHAFVGEGEIDVGDTGAELEEALQQIRIAEAELNAVLDRSLADALGGDDASEYVALVKTRRETLEAAREDLAEIEERRRPAAAGDIILFSELWPDLPMSEQRLLLASVFDCVFVRRTPVGARAGGSVPIEDRVHFCHVGDAPDLPVKGTRWEPKPFDFDTAASQDPA